MIVLLSKLGLTLHFRARNLAIRLLLLVFVASFVGSTFVKMISIPDAMYYASESPDIPVPTDEESLEIEDDFWESDESFINMSSISVSLSESICFLYQNNSLPQEFLNRPFTPPESGHS